MYDDKPIEKHSDIIEILNIRVRGNSKTAPSADEYIKLVKLVNILVDEVNKLKETN